MHNNEKRARINRWMRACLVVVMGVGVAHGQDPGWTINPADFESTMSLTGRVMQGNTAIAHPGDQVAVFAGTEIRGVTTGTVVGAETLFFLTAYADTDGESLSFRYFDAAAGVVRPIAETIVFETNGVRGLVSDPLVWMAEGAGPPTWSVNPSDFVSTMSITGQVLVNGAPAAAGSLLAAFVGEDVRGVADATDVNGQRYFFLTVYANTSGETVRLEAFDAVTGQVAEAAEQITFATNDVLGSVQSPLMFTVATATAVEQASDPTAPGALFDSAYPNPFTDEVRVRYRLPEAGRVRLSVVDILGRTVATLVNGRQGSGPHSAVFSSSDTLAAGTYFLRLQAGSTIETKPVLLLR